MKGHTIPERTRRKVFRYLSVISTVLGMGRAGAALVCDVSGRRAFRSVVFHVSWLRAAVALRNRDLEHLWESEAGRRPLSCAHTFSSLYLTGWGPIWTSYSEKQMQQGSCGFRGTEADLVLMPMLGTRPWGRWLPCGPETSVMYGSSREGRSHDRPVELPPSAPLGQRL